MRNAQVSSKANAALEKLSLAVALPHEKQAERLPIVPVTYTATCSLMAERTHLIPDGQTRRGILCRSPTFPLWLEQPADINVYLSDPSVAPSSYTAGSPWPLPSWNNFTAPATVVGGVTLSKDQMFLRTPFTTFGGLNLYIPKSSTFFFSVEGSAGSAGTVTVDIEYLVKGESYFTTFTTAFISTGKTKFTAVAGGTVATEGVLNDGTVPWGFVRILAVTVSNTMTAWAGPSVTLGYSVSASQRVLLPFSSPPEFVNSTIPYEHSRANAAAALFTNVGAVMFQEGTILAGRLKHEKVDFSSFAASDIDSVAPALRYFGPACKGLYTFTLPNDNSLDMRDYVSTQPITVVGGTYSGAAPLFDQDVGIYNAIVFADLASGTGSTQYAVSQYTHLEFDTVSSLFRLGASTNTLEDLHRAELALLKFGVFHENPLHWAAIAAAVKKAVTAAAPIVMPYVRAAAVATAKKGVQWLAGKVGGDRKMSPPAPLVNHVQRSRRVRAAPKRAKSKSRKR